MRGDKTTEKNGEWKATHFDQNELDDDETHGTLQGKKTQAPFLIKGALRQMVAMGYVSISFYTLPNSDIAAKLWSLTDIGRQVAKEEKEIPLLPNPTQLFETLSRYIFKF